MDTPIRLAYLLREIREGNIQREDVTPAMLKFAVDTSPLFSAKNVGQAWEIREIMQEHSLTLAEAKQVWNAAKPKGSGQS